MDKPETLADILLNDTATTMFTRDDWSRMGRGLITSDAEIAAMLAEGYEALIG